MKYKIKIALVIVLGLMVVSCHHDKKNENISVSKTEHGQVKLPNKVREILSQNLSKIIALSQQKIIQEAVIDSNKKYEGFNETELSKIDKKLQLDSKLYGETFYLMKNDCSKQLLSFQYKNPEFMEIFVTNKLGLNVCQTNKTSDYYQADEKWWQRAFKNGVGHNYFEDIHFDESAQIISFPLYVAIKNNNDHVIGIIKAVLDINSIKE